MSVLLVPDGLDGERVDVAAARMSGVSRSRISSLIEDGGVFLDGQLVSRASVRVATGQMLDVDLCDPVATPSITPQIVEGMRIIHDDSDIVVVDKPAGVLPTRPWDGRGQVSSSISRQLDSQFPQVVHRSVKGSFSVLTSVHPDSWWWPKASTLIPC